MPRFYSENVRWRVIYHAYFTNHSTEEISNALFVSPDWVNKIQALFRRTGRVSKKPTGHRSKKLTGMYREVDR